MKNSYIFLSILFTSTASVAEESIDFFLRRVSPNLVPISRLTCSLLCGVHISTWIPTSITCSGGMLKYAVALIAFLDMNEKRCSRQIAIPG